MRFREWKVGPSCVQVLRCLFFNRSFWNRAVKSFRKKIRGTPRLLAMSSAVPEGILVKLEDSPIPAPPPSIHQQTSASSTSTSFTRLTSQQVSSRISSILSSKKNEDDDDPFGLKATSSVRAAASRWLSFKCLIHLTLLFVALMKRCWQPMIQKRKETHFFRLKTYLNDTKSACTLND